MSITPINEKQEFNYNLHEISIFNQTALKQKYLFFRNWYIQKNILDLCSQSGFGTDYASIFASSTQGIFQNEQDFNKAQQNYPNNQFSITNLEEFDYTAYSLILAFNILEQFKKPEKLLEKLKCCNQDIILSVSSQHDIEKFKKLINKNFSDRKIQYLWQENRWPFLIKAHSTQDASHLIAVISDSTLPTWPKLGVAIPTHSGSTDLEQAFLTLSGGYPGETYFSVSANGCNLENLQILRNLESKVPYMFKLIRSNENLGYGRGANIGLQDLLNNQKPDYYIVSNDDILATRDCVSLLVEAMKVLEAQNQKPGIVAPVSNAVSGAQFVNIKPFHSLESMNRHAEEWHKSYHPNLFINPQVRGLFMVIHPDLIKVLGGFDPIFGIGNFEDDDYNIRAQIAGYTLWIAQGAFLYHKGSQTFKKLNIDYSANIQQNGRIFNRKWRVDEMQHAFEIREKPQHLELFIPFDAKPIPSLYTIEMDNRELNLVNEATNYEFLGWMMYMLTKYPQIDRQKVIELLHKEADLPIKKSA